jgi:hypothetical protein
LAGAAPRSPERYAAFGVQEWLKNYQRTNGLGVGGKSYNKVWLDKA